MTTMRGKEENLNVARGRTFFYRVLGFNDTHQPAWSNTESATTP